MIRRLVALALVLGARAAHAGSIHGQIVLPVERNEAPEGLWRVENGVLPVVPRAVDVRDEVVLALTKTSATKEPKSETVSVELRDLKLSQLVIAVPMGGTLVLKNADKVPHTISAGDLLSPKLTPAGTTRTERMQRPGIYPIHDDEMPHLHGWLVVTDGATSVHPDEHGAFHADLADGHYELQLFWRGAYVLTRTIDVNNKTADLTLTVPAGAKP